MKEKGRYGYKKKKISEKNLIKWPNPQICKELIFNTIFNTNNI